MRLAWVIFASTDVATDAPTCRLGLSARTRCGKAASSALFSRTRASKAASLIYLVPPAVAVEAYLVFGEPLTLPMILGTMIVVAGVYLVNRKPAPTAAMS